MLYGGKRHYLYLAGNISDDPETYHWRERFTDEMEKINEEIIQKGLADGKVFIMMDPCDNAFNAEWKENINILRHNPSDHLGLLLPKDYHMNKIASIFVAHLGLWTPEKPMVGTIIEHAWAYKDFHLPIIQIVGDETSPYARHQWLKQISSARVFDEFEAAHVIKYFFAPGPRRARSAEREKTSELEAKVKGD